MNMDVSTIKTLTINLPRVLTSALEIPDAIDRAAFLAVLCHSGQVDKANKPYISHVARVAMGSLGDKHQIVGWLHDVVEDTPITVKDINFLFGEDIALAVDAISRRQGESNTAYGKRCNQNRIARRVKIVDILDNLRPDRLANTTINIKAHRAQLFKLLEILNANITGY